MSIVFGSKEARELLRREGGFEFDLHDVEPLGYRRMTVARHARLAEELGQAEEEVETWCRVCEAYMHWDADRGRWFCADVREPFGRGDMVHP